MATPTATRVHSAKVLRKAINAAGSIDGAAQLLGVHRTTLYRQLRLRNVQLRRVLVAR